MLQATIHYIRYTVEAAVLLMAAGVILGLKIRPWLAWSVAALGILTFVVTMCLGVGVRDNDLSIFWDAGRAALSGRDPYADSLFLNPPSALPVYAALAMLSFPICVAFWTAINVLGTLALIELSHRCLINDPDYGAERLRPEQLAVLTAAVSLSFAARYAVTHGQTAVVNACLVLAALISRGRGQPIRAGVGLALASIKIGMMLPFLILFHRKEDRAAWLSCAVVGLGLCAIATPISELIPRCREMLGNIARQEAHVNDYTAANSSSVELLGIDRAGYCVGLSDRTTLKLLQVVVVAALGATIAYAVAWRRSLPDGAAMSLVALYSLLFFYHRLYDAVILALPLVYFTGRARSERGGARWLFIAGAVSILTVLNLRVGILRSIAQAAPDHGIRVVFLQRVLLPYGTWCILAAMLCLWLAAYRSGTTRSARGRVDPSPQALGHGR